MNQTRAALSSFLLLKTELLFQVASWSERNEIKMLWVEKKCFLPLQKHQAKWIKFRKGFSWERSEYNVKKAEVFMVVQSGPHYGLKSCPLWRKVVIVVQSLSFAALMSIYKQSTSFCSPMHSLLQLFLKL